MKRNIPLVLLLGFVLVFAGCNSAPQQSGAETGSQPIPLKVGMLSYSSFLPIYIAQAENYYSDQGLDVELISFGGADEALIAMLRGDIDVVSAPMNLASFSAMAEEPAVRIVADKGYLDPNGCTYTAWFASNEVLNSGELDDLTNLADMTIVSGTNINQYVLDTILEPVGLQYEDMNTVDIPTPNRAEALKNGAVDIAVFGEPWIERALSADAGGVWVSWEDVLPNLQLAVIYFGPSITEENPEAGNRFMVAYEEAVRQYSEGKTDRNVELMVEFTQLDQQEVREMCWQSFSPDGSIDTQSIQEYQEWAVSKGHLDRVLSVDEYWDSSYLDYALGVLDSR